MEKKSNFKASVLAVLLYGCESWVLTNNQERQLNTFGTRCYRGILGISLYEHMTNQELYQRVGQKSIIEIIRERQLRWLGHALRRKESEPSRVFALYEPEAGHGKPKQGRPKLIWSEYIIRLLAPYRTGLTTRDVESLAQDRKRWKNIVAVCSTAID